MFKAGILIDDHAVTEDGREVIGRGLEVYKWLALGRFDKLIPYLEITLSKSCDPPTMDKIKDLIFKIDRVLWKGKGKDKDKLDVYDERVAHTGLLAHLLQQRLLCNENEVVKAADHLKMLQDRIMEMYNGNDCTPEE